MAWDLYRLHYEGDSAERHYSENNYIFYRGEVFSQYYICIIDNTFLDCSQHRKFFFFNY